MGCAVVLPGCEAKLVDAAWVGQPMGFFESETDAASDPVHMMEA